MEPSVIMFIIPEIGYYLQLSKVRWRHKRREQKNSHGLLELSIWLVFLQRPAGRSWTNNSHNRRDTAYRSTLSDCRRRLVLVSTLQGRLEKCHLDINDWFVGRKERQWSSHNRPWRIPCHSIDELLSRLVNLLISFCLAFQLDMLIRISFHL